MVDKDLSGRTIGGYQVLRKLGQGGMATVYRAHEQSLNREVALKVISPHLAEQDEFVQRFQREAQAAARLSHPNIVPIYSIGQDAGVHYYAMEYVRGRTLAEVVAEEGPMPPERAVPIFRQAAEALTAAHDAGIVHRDIKPANIMLDQAGRVRVTDFGIAQIANEKGMTRTGALIGTPEFMSPEQCMGEKPDARSDLYSLGVTFFQVLAGKTPFTAETPGHLLLQIMHGERVPMEEINPPLPAGLRDLLARMMASDREQRVQTARDVVMALDAFSSGRPYAAALAEAPTMAGAAVAATAVPSRGTRSMAIAVVLLLVLLLGAFAAWAALRPQGQPMVAEEPAPLAQAPGAAPEEIAQDVRTASADNLQEQDEAAPASGVEAPPEPAAGAVASDTPPPGRDGAGVATEAPAAAADEPVAAKTADDRPTVGVSAPPALPGQTGPGPIPVGAAASGGAELPAPQFMPAPDTVVLDMTGEYEYIDLVSAWIEQELGARGFTVVAMPSAGYIADVARTQLVATAKLVGARDLYFLGRAETQYTVGLTLRGVDALSGEVVAGPFAETIEYTARNLQTQLEREARKLTVEFATALRQAQQ